MQLSVCSSVSVIKLNTSVAPRRNLMSQNVLEQALLLQATWLGGNLPSHRLCCQVNPLPRSSFSTLTFLCLAFSGPPWFLLFTIYHVFDGPRHLPDKASVVGTLDTVTHQLTYYISLYIEMKDSPCLLPQSTTVIHAVLKKNHPNEKLG